MISFNPSGYFITASDTDAGKTYIACELIRQLRESGIPLEVRKPVESGCEQDQSGSKVAADALKLQAANSNQESLEHIVRYRFAAALAPHRAARMEGCELYLSDLVTACAPKNNATALIVEGAGGFYSPLAEDGLNADLAGALKLPVIIVVKDKIGAVNQALLTIQAVENRGLAVAAIIMSEAEPRQDPSMDNVADLKVYCHYPVFRCYYQGRLEPIFTHL